MMHYRTKMFLNLIGNNIFRNTMKKNDKNSCIDKNAFMK